MPTFLTNEPKFISAVVLVPCTCPGMYVYTCVTSCLWDWFTPAPVWRFNQRQQVSPDKPGFWRLNWVLNKPNPPAASTELCNEFIFFLRFYLHQICLVAITNLSGVVPRAPFAGKQVTCGISKVFPTTRTLGCNSEYYYINLIILYWFIIKMILWNS